jgi:drug/metabolite transporter (DMT)-like permease
VIWAAVAGVGFGLFQSTNRAALRGVDPYTSTFLQLLVSTVILAAVALATEDLGRLAGAPASAWWAFSVAGLVHFFVGWTLLNLSQQRLGATRTSPLIATTPLFGVVIAALTIHEVPGVRALAGVALIVVGVYAVELDRLRRGGSGGLKSEAGTQEAGGHVEPSGSPPADQGSGGLASEAAAGLASLFGLGTALCWAVSPILVREGLHGLPSPLLGVTIGLVAATLAYGLALLPRGRRGTWGTREAMGWKLVAGILVGVSTWTRWYAVALVPVAAVLGLGLLSVPTVMAAAPLLVGRHLERVTTAVVAGSALVVAGALVLIAGP